MNWPRQRPAFKAPRLVGLLLLCATLLTACGPIVSVAKDSIPVASAKVIPWSVAPSTNSPTDRIIVAHARDGWHAFLAWSPQSGH